MKKQEIIPKQIKEIHIGTGKVIKHTVMVNVRECGLDFMLHRGLIKEKQHRAGIIFRRYFERASVGGYKSIDLEKGRVSGGSQDSIPDSVLSAISGLHKARDTLGDQGYKIAIYICGQDYSLVETRKVLNIKSRYMGERLREVLSDLASLYGCI